MFTRSLIAASIAAGLMVSAANAVTIVNTDKARENFVYTPHKGKAHHYTLAANHRKSFACTTGGTFMIGKSVEHCTAKTAKILIKGGKLAL